MCIIAICEEKTLPKEEFFKCFESNRDGFGFSWRGKEKVQFIKGLMKVDEAWDVYNKFVTIGENLFPHILHFRLGSPVIPELTHPFIVSENSELYKNSKKARKKVQFDSVLFHNGIISGWKDMLINMFVANGNIPEGEWSDTRMVAIMVNKLGNEVLNYISGKYVFFSQDELFVSGKFEKDSDLKGIQFSNSSYKVYRKSYLKPVTPYSQYHSEYNYNNTLFSLNKSLHEIDEFII
jgi:hypothetical protein